MQECCVRYALVVCLFAGCYQPARLDCTVSCANGASCSGGLTCGSDQLCHPGSNECTQTDASVGDAEVPSDAAVDAPPRAYCDPDQPALVACYEFEMTGTDASRNKLNAANASSFGPGKVGLAVKVNGTSTVHIPDSARLDLQRFTIEAWVNESAKGTANEAVLVNIGEYGLFIDPTNHPFCAYAVAPGGLANLRTAVANTTLALATWTHLACTFDGSHLTLYVGGAVAAQFNQTNNIFTEPQSGTSVGGAGTDPTAGFLGLIDELRILSSARPAAEICADAGKPSC